MNEHFLRSVFSGLLMSLTYHDLNHDQFCSLNLSNLQLCLNVSHVEMIYLSLGLSSSHTAYVILRTVRQSIYLVI